MNAESMEAKSTKTTWAKLAAMAAALLLALGLCAGLSGCTGDDDEDDATSTIGSYEAEETSIQELVIFEQDGLTITATEAVAVDDMTYLLVDVTNDTDENLYVTNADDFTVGDASTEVTLAVSVDAGETEEDQKMWFKDISTADELCDDVSGTVSVWDADSYETLYDADVAFTVKSSLF